MTTITELRELMAKATPGPWMNNTVYECIHTHSGKLLPIMAYHHRGANNESDAALIVAAINAMPALLDLAEAAKGLSMGEDWNNGTQAKTHGYRKKLLGAIAKLEAAK